MATLQGFRPKRTKVIFRPALKTGLHHPDNLTPSNQEPEAGLASTHFGSMKRQAHCEVTPERQSLRERAQISLTPLGTWWRVGTWLHKMVDREGRVGRGKGGWDVDRDGEGGGWLMRGGMWVEEEIEGEENHQLQEEQEIPLEECSCKSPGPPGRYLEQSLPLRYRGTGDIWWSHCRGNIRRGKGWRTS